MPPLFAEAVTLAVDLWSLVTLGVMVVVGFAVHGFLTARAIDRSAGAVERNTEAMHAIDTAIKVIAAQMNR